MYQPFVAAGAPITYNAAQQTAGFMGQQSAVPAYGMVTYPASTGAAGYSGYAATTHAQTYSGLDAAVYSAATAMLAERGVTPHQKTYNPNISGYPTSTANSSANSAWNRIESMNPATPVSAPPSRGGGRGGSRGGGFSGRGGRGGARGGYGRYGSDKPKDPANQAVHYCEVCKVSCAGQASFQAHVIGTKHKKREQQAKWEKDQAAKATPGQSGDQAAAAAPRRAAVFGQGQKCELCGISTAGPAAYDAHIKGKNHQRTLKLHMQMGKPIPINEPSVNMRTVDTINPRPGTGRSEIVSGSSVCTKVITGGKTVLITPKMNFVGGTVLHTTENGVQEVPKTDQNGTAGTTQPVTPAAPAQNANGAGPSTSFNGSPKKNSPPKTNNSNAEPIGESYVQKTERAGKVAYYRCTLCDCDFSDESGMSSHIRGRRHRLAYQKKVDPTIVVEMPKSVQKSRAIQDARMARVRGKRPVPGPGEPYNGPPPKRMPPAPRPPFSGQWNPPPGPYHPPPPPMHHYGPPEPHFTPPMGPPAGSGPFARPGLLAPPNSFSGGPPQPFQGHPGPMYQPPPANPMERLPFDQDESFEEQQVVEPPRPVNPAVSRLDQHYLLMKHRQVVPTSRDVESLQRAVTNVEHALKNLTEKLMVPTETKPTDPANPAGTATDGALLPQPPQKFLKGLFRFGALTKNLLTRDNMIGEVLLIATRHPDAKDLDMVADALQAELKIICPLLVFAVVAHADQCGIFVKEQEQSPAKSEPHSSGIVDTSPPEPELCHPVWVYLAYGSLRDELFKAATEHAAASGDGSPAKTAGGAVASCGGSSDPSTTPVMNGGVTTVSTADATTAVAVTEIAAASPATATAVSALAAMENGHKAAVSAVDAFKHGLDLKRSLAVLAQSRRSRWFQEFITFFPQCRMLMRVLNHVCEHNADLRLLAGWPVEYLTITTLRMQAAFLQVAPLDIPLPEAFWMILSKVAGGALLPGCPNGFKDPCERGAVDILGSATVEERVRLAKGVSNLIARWLTGDYAKVLDIAALPEDPLYQMDVTTSAAPISSAPVESNPPDVNMTEIPLPAVTSL